MVQCIHLNSDEVTKQLNTASKDFVWFSLTMVENTVSQDTSQIHVFLRVIDDNFIITELLSLESMKTTNIGQDLIESVGHCVEKCLVMK